MATLGNFYKRLFPNMPSRTGNVFDAGDDFWNEYDKLPASYRKQMDPYLSYDYHLGIWDRIGDALGFNTAEDKYKMEMQSLARQQLVQLQNDSFQNEFNSQAAQASRQRDAGLNPDLAGEAQGDSAAGFEQPNSLFDPSIFEQPVEIPDLLGLFDTAIGSLKSVAEFKNLMHVARGSKSAAIGTEINNVQDAYNFAGDYLTAFDPKFRRDDPEADLTPSEFEKIAASKIESIPTTFSYLSKDAQRMLTHAVRQRSSDPRIYEKYYSNAKAASLSHADKVASDVVYGRYDLADETFKEANNITYKYLVERNKLRLQTSKIMSQYELQKAQNDFDFERFKTKYGLPEEWVETDFQEQMARQAKASMEKLKYEVSEDWIRYLDRLRKSNDPASIYLFNAIVQGGYSPLMSTSFSAGAFGLNGSGSFQSFVTPEMNPPFKGITSGMSPAKIDPYGWSWIDNK